MIRDPELVREIGAATALEVRATGIQYVFAPCIAVNEFISVKKTLVDFVLNTLFSYNRPSRFAEIQDGAVATRAIVRILRLSGQ